MANASATKSNRLAILIVCAVGVVCLGIVGPAIHSVLSDRASWVMRVDNEPHAMWIRLSTTKSDEPIYQIHVRGAHFNGAPITLPDAAADTVKINGIETSFRDPSMGPGRWTVSVDGVKLDFWSVYLFVDGVRYEAPADVTIDRSANRGEETSPTGPVGGP